MLNIQANHTLTHGVGTTILWQVPYEKTDLLPRSVPPGRRIADENVCQILESWMV